MIYLFSLMLGCGPKQSNTATTPDVPSSQTIVNTNTATDMAMLNGIPTKICNECEGCEDLNVCATQHDFPACHLQPCCDGSIEIDGACSICPEGTAPNEAKNLCLPQGAIEEVMLHPTVQEKMTAVPIEMLFDGTEPRLGNPSAKIQLLQISDYQCPHCSTAAMLLFQLAEKPDISVRYTHYPLSNKCNSKITGDYHTEACYAAYASECALEQNKFWELHRILFENQKEISPAMINSSVEKLGLNMQVYTNCMSQNSTRSKIQADVTFGHQLNITGTPTIFIAYDDVWYQWTGSVNELGDILSQL